MSRFVFVDLPLISDPESEPNDGNIGGHHLIAIRNFQLESVVLGEELQLEELFDTGSLSSVADGALGD